VSFLVGCCLIIPMADHTATPFCASLQICNVRLKMWVFWVES